MPDDLPQPPPPSESAIWPHPIHEPKTFISAGRQIQATFDKTSGRPVSFHGIANDPRYNNHGPITIQYPFEIKAATVEDAFAKFDAEFSLVREMRWQEYQKQHPEQFSFTHGLMLG